MANNNNEGVDNSPDNSKDAGSEKSFVGKFMSGIFNSTPLSKWFGKDAASRSVIRRRDEDEDYDASFSFQPPSKRVKLPPEAERNSYSAHVFESPVAVHTSNNVNNVSTKVYGKFPEPVPGPSGIKSRKLFERHNTSSTNTISTNSFEHNLEVINGDHDSDSGESTSGYSSAPKLVTKQKSEETSNKNTESVVPKARSLFTSSTDSSSGRTLFPDRSSQMNTSLSSRRPTFNASTFGSPNFVDRTLATKRIMNSPFYSGRTMYGGASAYGRRLGKSSEELNVVPRTSVQIKPVNEKLTNENTTLSKTARRILNTLEQYSTPISDAKKIPVSPRRPGLLSPYVGAAPYLTRDKKRALHKELQVPSIPDLLQMKQKERLQNSTETVRQIATKSKSSLNKEDYKLRTDEDNKQKHSNKMKSSVASARPKVQSMESVSEVKLPKVSLPITTLPKFDFVLMPSGNSHETNQVIGASKSSNVTKSPVSTIAKRTIVVEKKETETKDTDKVKTNDYTFSEPLVISKDLKSVAAINCFKFSEPLCKKEASDVGMVFKSGDGSLKSGLKVKNNGENVNFTGVKPAGQLLTGSVMDVLGKKKEASSGVRTVERKWECPTCLVRNASDKTKCVACDEPKPQTQLDKTESKGFGDQFKLSSDKWECTSCLVRNNNSETKCVACAAAKPGSQKPTVTSGFGDKFKPPASTWECTSCLIRNKNELEQCAACGTAKVAKGPAAASFGDKFKPSSDTWECGTCMIRNKNELDKCAACETARPGAKTASTQKPVTFTNSSGTTFTFGIKQEWECKTCMIKNKNDLTKCAACESPKDSGSSMKTGFGDVFKMKSGEWECPSCMVKNKPTVNVCVCCGVTKPGGTSEKLAEICKNEEKKPVNSFNFGIDKSATTQFKFGVPSSTSDTKDSTVVSTAPTFVFTDASKSIAATPTTFTFGINTQEKVAPTQTVTSTSETTNSVSTNPLLKPSEKLPEKAASAPVGFKFGLDNSLNKNTSSETVVSSSGKTETSSVGTFSTSFVPTSMPPPTFQFKPAAVNGDINKPKEAVFGGDTAKANIFGDLNKPKEAIFGTDKSKESPFAKLSKPTESPFSGTAKTADSPFGTTSKPSDSPFGVPNKSIDSPFGITSKTTDSPFGATNKTTDSLFGTTNKTTDSPFSTPNKTNESPFGTTTKSDSTFGTTNKSTVLQFGNVTKSTASPFGTVSTKPTDSPFGGATKTTDSPFAAPNRPAESPFTATSKPADSPFAPSSKPAESLFGTSNKHVDSPFPTPNKSIESLFGKPNKPADSPFGTINKPTNSPFGNVPDTNKPKDSVFGAPPDANKPQGSLFGNVNEATKPPEPRFGSDANKPKEIMFGAKPPENKNLFAPPTTTPFSFSTKPVESTSSAFPAPQPATGGIFKFGAEEAQKRLNSDSADTNVNGFGTAPKISAFGGPQTFGTTENKPFGFGSTDSTPKSSGFTFGQTEKPNAAGPVFNFGPGAQTAPTGGFNFAVTNTGFSFGGAPKVESQPFNPPSTNMFGPAGAGAKNGSFNFGTNANNNNQKAVFSFGANQTSQPTQPSFPTQSQPGFNFVPSAAPLNMPGSSFNFTGAPPSFSFTDGNTNQTQPPRKIKKAIRRTTHR
ncbi:nuclear pore complex protein Nup153-like [Zophobas morio]|uniref:nuclear pore complex protein Nup153-like n=1 Tax=Zophobas morio TaxID=2755281 RepID=UPI003082C5B4